MSAISTAISRYGSATAMARDLNVSPQAVIFWRDGERQFPAKYAPRVERITGVRCEDLCPDVEWGVLRQPPVEI